MYADQPYALLAVVAYGPYHALCVMFAGGCAMDAGCYCAHALRFFPGVQRPRVLQATASKLLDGGRVDGAVSATVAYTDSANSSGNCRRRSCAKRWLAPGAVGHMHADLRAGNLLLPTTRLIASCSRCVRSHSSVSHAPALCQARCRRCSIAMATITEGMVPPPHHPTHPPTRDCVDTWLQGLTCL